MFIEPVGDNSKMNLLHVQCKIVMAFNNRTRFFLTAIPYPGVALWADQHADRRLHYREWTLIVTLHHSASTVQTFSIGRITSPFLEGSTPRCLIRTVTVDLIGLFMWNSHVPICKRTWFACHRSLIRFESLTILFVEIIIELTRVDFLFKRCLLW